MMSFSRTPLSIAIRVSAGRQSTALRSWVIASRLRPIGFVLRPLRTLPSASRRPPGVLRAKGNLQMKLGVHVGYWGLGLTAEDQLAIVVEAERLGYDSVWTAEAYGSDAATVLAWLAANTERIRLGSAIFQMPGAARR